MKEINGRKEKAADRKALRENREKEKTKRKE